MRINNTKIRRKLAGSILLILILVFPAEGQQPECIFIQFDKSFYISGETIWFKVYLLNDSGESKSRVLHVDLVSHKNETVVQQKLLIDNGTSNGSITLPMDSEEGYYRFRAYTHYNLNFEPAFIYETNIPVYQPYKEDFLLSDPIISEKIQSSGTADISIVSDKKNYKPRDSLTVSVQINGSKDTGREGNFSISVVPLEIASHEFQSHNHSEFVEGALNGNSLIDPERSLFIEGTLRDANTKLNVTSGRISIYMDKTSQFLRAFSRDGKIKVPVPDYWGPGTFQILNHDPYHHAALELIQKYALEDKLNSPDYHPSVLEFIPDSGGKFESPYFHSDLPTRTPVIVKYMDQLQKRRKFIELFDLYKPQEIQYSTVSAMVPDNVYQTKDYQEIYSLEQFINEAIINVKVRTIDGIKTVRLFNREKGGLFEDHPWYMVDGFLTFDEKEILNIQYLDIIEIRLYSKISTITEYFERFMSRNGVIEIITRDVKSTRELKNNPNVVEIDGFSLPQNFDSTLTLSESKTTPDLRGVIYWSPDVLTNEHGQGQITIPLSDDTGKFAIVVMGTADFHEPVTGYSTFEVKLE